jgi:hypothetical protein
MYVSLTGALRPITLEDETDNLPERTGERSRRMAQKAEVIAVAERLVAEGGRCYGAPLAPPVEVKVGAAPGAEVTVSTRDVNGDGHLDAVVKDNSGGGSSTLLNGGGGALEHSAISLVKPTDTEIERLANSGEGKSAGRQFLSIDLNGDGKYQLAVKEGEQWLSLGETTAAPGAAGAGGTEGSAQTALAEAENRFEWIVGQLSPSMPVQAFDQNGQIDPHNPGQGRQVGFVQMLSGNTSQDIYSAYNMGATDPSEFVMFDSFGGVVNAFDPFGVGFALYEGGSEPGAEPEAAGAAATLPAPPASLPRP